MRDREQKRRFSAAQYQYGRVGDRGDPNGCFDRIKAMSDPDRVAFMTDKCLHCGGLGCDG